MRKRHFYLLYFYHSLFLRFLLKILEILTKLSPLDEMLKFGQKIGKKGSFDKKPTIRSQLAFTVDLI